MYQSVFKYLVLNRQLTFPGVGNFYCAQSSALFDYKKDSLRQRYSSLDLQIGLRNKEVNSFGISYDPSLAITAFGDNRKGRETDVVLNAPITKTFDEAISFKVAFTADVTSYKTFNA